MLTPAKTWEANGDYSRAIDAYLKMTVMQTTDYALLEEVCCSELCFLPKLILLIRHFNSSELCFLPKQIL